MDSTNPPEDIAPFKEEEQEGAVGHENARHAFFATAVPSVANLARVAEPLGDLRDRIVFIGGAIAPLLQTHPPFPRVRPTKDVDGVIASSSYLEANKVHEELALRGFRHDTTSTAHVHRWIAPDHITLFDLIPAGSHPGGSGNPWDQLAIDTADVYELYSGLQIRHATAPAFLALKWSAHRDRGLHDPRQSHDLEDLLALIASRPTLVTEVQRSPEQLREFIRQQADELLNDPDIDELFESHLNNAPSRREVVRAVRATLIELAQKER